MTTVTVISDLHLEARSLTLDQILSPDVSSDVLCLLGDIGDPLSDAYRDLLAAAAARFPTVLLLAGNNEYRNHDGGGRSMLQTEDLIRQLASAHPNVHFLQNDTFVVRDLAFIGTTLWSHVPDAPLPQPDGGAAHRTAAAAPAPVPAAPAPAPEVSRAADASVASPPVVPDAGVAESLTAASPATTVASPGLGISGSRDDDGDGDGDVAAGQPTAVPRWSQRSTATGTALPSHSGRGLLACRPPPCTAAFARVLSEENQDLGAVRFLSYTQQLVSSPVLNLQNLFSANSMGGGGGGADSRCRRLVMRHSVSLSSLRPDEPCPPWRVQDSTDGSSSESDARSSSSDDDDGSERRSDGSDGEGSGSGPNSGEESRQRSRRQRARISSSAPVANTTHLCCSSSGPPAKVNICYALSERMPPQPSPAAAAAHATARPPASRFGPLGAAAGQEPGSAPGVLLEPVPEADTVFSAAAAAAAAASAAEAEESAAAHSRHHHRHHHHAAAAAAEPPPPAAPATIREYIGATSLDYRRIFASPGGPAITPDVTNAIFAASLQYLRATVAAAREHGLVPVVLSHHAPSLSGTCRPSFAGHPSTHAYATDLEPYLVDSGIAAWYCGHTHYNFDFELKGGIRLASNQYGSQPQPADGYSRTWQHRLAAPAAAPRGYSPGGAAPVEPPRVPSGRRNSWVGGAAGRQPPAEPTIPATPMVCI